MAKRAGQAITIAILVLVANQCFASNYTSAPWYKCAGEYLQAGDALTHNDLDQQGRLPEDYGRLEQARRNLVNSLPPDEEAIEKLLASSVQHDRQVGLTIVSVQGVGWKAFLRKSPVLFGSQTDLATRAMIYSCLRASNQDIFVAVEDEFVGLLTRETDLFLLGTNLFLLTRLSNEKKTVDAFVALLKRPDEKINKIILQILDSDRIPPSVQKKV